MGVLCGSTIVYGGSQSAEASSTSPNSKKNKMSKVETLRCAVEYIGNLEKLLRSSRGDIKEEPLDGHVTPVPVHFDEENISPDFGGSLNDMSSFYDSSEMFSSSKWTGMGVT